MLGEQRNWRVETGAGCFHRKTVLWAGGTELSSRGQWLWWQPSATQPDCGSRMEQEAGVTRYGPRRPQGHVELVLSPLGSCVQRSG